MSFSKSMYWVWGPFLRSLLERLCCIRLCTRDLDFEGFVQGFKCLEVRGAGFGAQIVETKRSRSNLLAQDCLENGFGLKTMFQEVVQM